MSFHGVQLRWFGDNFAFIETYYRSTKDSSIKTLCGSIERYSLRYSLRYSILSNDLTCNRNILSPRCGSLFLQTNIWNYRLLTMTQPGATSSTFETISISQEAGTDWNETEITHHREDIRDTRSFDLIIWAQKLSEQSWAMHGEIFYFEWIRFIQKAWWLMICLM